MDFLPYPEEPAQPGIEVPFLCSDENRRRYATPDIDTINVASFVGLLLPTIDDSMDGLEVAMLAQACIYFPILQKLVGESFNIQDFIGHSTSSPSDQVITLRKLSKACGWEKKWFFDRDEVFDKLLDDLSLGYRPAFDTFLEAICLLEALGSPCNFICFSILALLWSISPNRMSEFRIIRKGIYHSWLEQRMTTVGWCPYWTGVYARQLSPFMLYYLSGRPGSRPASHEGCELNKPCRVYGVNKKTYRTKHAPGCDGTGCVFRGVEGKDVERLVSIISRGAIPLIRLRPVNDLPGAHVKVELVEHRYGKPFIAISHVWSGGLGHFFANTLPQCQLDFLYLKARLCKQKLYGEKFTFFELFHEDTTDLINGLEGIWPLYPLHQAAKSLRWFEEMYKPVILGATGEDISEAHLWIDTLCIPADPNIPDQRTVQGNAIDSMALVYSMAMQVLVIDQSVREVSLDSESGLSIAAELLTSPWMTRSWTYQEGSLSRDISFLLKNGFVNPRKEPFPNLGNTIAKKQSTFEKVLMAEFLREVNNIPDILNLSVTGVSRRESGLFIRIWNDLATRTTSEPDDLHGLLAVLLGLSAHEILARRTQIRKAAGANALESQEEDLRELPIRSPDERMLAVYRAQPSLPISMLLIPFPRNTPMCNGNEWMPRFPAGSLDGKFGMMRWKCSDEVFRLSLSLSDSNLWCLIMECGIEDLSNTVFPISAYSSFGIPSSGEHKLDWISVRLHPPSANSIRRVPSGSKLCLLIDHNEYCGCCLFLSDTDKDTGLPLYLNFVCPLTYQKQSAATSRGLAAGSRRVIQPPTRFVTSGECLLNCEIPAPVSPRYRRPIAKTLQRSLTVPIGITLALDWAVAAITLFTDPCWQQINPLKSTPLTRWMSTTPGLGWYWALSQRYMLHMRVILPLCLTLGRVCMFALIDYPRLEAVAERVRYERLAKSLACVPVSDLESEQPTRLNIEPSYQFPRGWLVWIPVGVALYGIGGSYVAPMYVIPKSWQYGWEKATGRFLAQAVLGELVGRVVLETVWRYFRLDLPRQRKPRE